MPGPRRTRVLCDRQGDLGTSHSPADARGQERAAGFRDSCAPLAVGDRHSDIQQTAGGRRGECGGLHGDHAREHGDRDRNLISLALIRRANDHRAVAKTRDLPRLCHGGNCGVGTGPATRLASAWTCPRRTGCLDAMFQSACRTRTQRVPSRRKDISNGTIDDGSWTCTMASSDPAWCSRSIRLPFVTSA